MHNFEVWAPRATHVALCLAGHTQPMRSRPSGWWTASSETSGPGTDYGFSLNGSDPRPDPRSEWQPEGVHGLSRVTDHSSFVWTDEQWRGVQLAGSVIYELHIGTFSQEGTFDAAIAHLDHLVRLGVDIVELLPVAEFSGDRGWGYDCVDLYAPHHAYGGPEGLKRFVDACHSHGLGVVMDVVYNHLGPAGNYLEEFGPYFTEKHSTTWGPGLNFDGADSGEVRQFVLANAEMWLCDYHCDGLRLYAVHAIRDDSALHILEELAIRIDALGAHHRRMFFAIAESDLNDPGIIRSREAGGFGLSAVYADEFHHALHAVLTREATGYYEDFGTLAILSKAIRNAWVYTGEYSQHRHRVHGRSPDGINGQRFVVFLQNHDQIGNRAVGDRISSTITTGRTKIGAALVILSTFVPMIFQGEEWGASTPFMYFTDHLDAELAKKVSSGRRQEFSDFGWRGDELPDPQDFETFRVSRLDWVEVETPAHAELLDWYTTLLRLRRSLGQVTDGAIESTQTSYDEDNGWLMIERPHLTIAVNIGANDIELTVSSSADILAASEDDISLRNGNLFLPRDAVVVLRV